jgi:VCBS repeat protein
LKSKTKLRCVTQVRVAAGYHEPLEIEKKFKYALNAMYFKEGFMFKKQLFIFALLLAVYGCGGSGSTNEKPDDKLIRTVDLFSPYESIATGVTPESVRVTDLNNDNLDDIVVFTRFSPVQTDACKLFIFIQNSHGTLDPPQIIATNADNANTPGFVDAGDIDNDGVIEIVAAIDRYALEIFEQDQNGIFSSDALILSANATKLKIGDVNNDGLQDIVCIGHSTDTVDIFFQGNNGSLEPVLTLPIDHKGFEDLEIKDTNSDNLNDIVISDGTWATREIGILHQTNNGFSSPIYISNLANENISSLAAEDLNNDGMNDIIVTYEENRPGAHIATFFQSQNGTFSPASNIPTYDIPTSINVIDLNFDRKNDIITLNGSWENIQTFINDGNGGFIEQLYGMPMYQNAGPQSMEIGDINNDGLFDVVTGEDNGIIVFFGE